MTSFVEFLAGNLLAIVAVAVVGVLAIVVFTLGGSSRHRPTPTHPITTVDDLHAEPTTVDDRHTGPTTKTGTDSGRATGSAGTGRSPAHSNDAASAATDPLAVVGTVQCRSPIDPPFVGELAVAFELRVAGPFGYITTVRRQTAFTVRVGDEQVRVPPAESRGSDGPTIDDTRREQTRRLQSATAISEQTHQTLRAFDGARTRRRRYLTGSLLPRLTGRTYRVRWVAPGDEIAIVGRLTDDDGDYVLRPPRNGALRILDPGTVSKDH